MSKRGVQTGTKMPSRYAGGNPYVNLALGILLDAKKDARMWIDCLKEFGVDRENYDTLAIAHWVIEWLSEHRLQADAMGLCEEDLEALIKFREGNVVP